MSNEELFKNDLNLLPDPTPDWEMSGKDWAAVLGAALGAFLAILDIQITNASLREIQGSLGLDLSEGGWISTSYLIAEVVVIPLTAFLSKVFGLRRYILFNGVFFIFSSMLCGLAWSPGSIIFFRVLQGLSGGVLIPLSFQTMLLFMPPEKKPIGLSIFGLIATLAPTLGPTIGGWLTENYGWRTNFFINLFPGMLMLATISYGMPNASMKLSKLKEIDIPGMVLLTLGLASLTYMLEKGGHVEWFNSDGIRYTALISLICLPTFVYIQFIKKKPLLNLYLLTERNFLISALITMLTAVALFGGIYSLSVYLSQLQGYSAIRIGEVMMWVGIPQLFVMPLMPFLMKRVDLRVLIFGGMALFVFSNFMNTFLSFSYAGNEFRYSLIVRAIAQPLFLIPLSALAMALVSPLEAGNASSLYNVMRNIGGSLGIALAETTLITRTSDHAARNMEQVVSGSFKVTERLTGIQHYLLFKGEDPTKIKMQSMQLLNALAYRESLTQAFADIFFLITLVLILCCSLILFLKSSNSDHHKDLELH